MKKSLVYTLLSYLLLLPLFTVAQDAYLGVHALHMSDEKADILGFEVDNGYYVASVIKDTPAEKIGLQPFDYITAVDDEPLVGNRDLGDALDEYQVGDEVAITFLRNGQSFTKTVQLAGQMRNNNRLLSPEVDPFLGVHNTHDDLPASLAYGVPVNVQECSTADQIGMKNKDVIIAIDERPMFDWNDLGVAIDNREIGDAIEVTVVRKRETMTLTGTILSLAATKGCDEMEQATIDEPSVVDMEDVTEEEAKEMEENYGIDMPIVNNLEIVELQLFPNPTSGIFELRFDLPNEGQTNIRLFNSNAQLILQRNLGNFSGTFSERLDISTNTRGFYFLEIRQNDLSISKKLILQ